MSFPLMPLTDFVETSGPTVVHTASAGTSSNTFTYTFLGQSVGPASSGRLLVVCAMINAKSTESYGISSITIGGVAAIIAVESSAGKNSTIAYTVDSTGSTEDIVVTLTGSGTPGRCTIDVFAITGYTNIVPETTASAFSDTSVSSLTAPVSASSNAVAIACCYVGNNGTSGASWTAPMTEVSDRAIESTTFTAAMSGALPQGTTNVTVTPPIAIDMSMSVAVWR